MSCNELTDQLSSIAIKDENRLSQALATSIETFNAAALRNVKTQEKVILPSKEDIEAEKRQVGQVVTT